MTVTSGLKCFESYGKSARCTSLVRTCLESSIWHSTRCFLSWKTKATKHNRLLFQLAVSTPRTGETEYLFWPTPSTGASLCGGTGNLQQLRKLAQAGKMTADELRNLSSGGGGNTNPELIEWLMGYEKAFTRLMPTAKSSDYKGAASTRFFGGVLPQKPNRTSGSHSPWDYWPSESGIPRVVHGVPDRVDRIKCLGNAVVPQQAYPLFEAIRKEMEKSNGHQTD